MLPEQYDDRPCSECGNWHPQDFMKFENNEWVCANCKPEILREEPYV